MRLTVVKFDESDWIRNSGQFADYIGDGEGGGGGSGAAESETVSDDDLTAHRKEFRSRLSPEEQAAVDAYQGDFKSGKSLSAAENKALDSALEKADPLAKDTVLYRAMRGNSSIAVGSELRVGSKFTSTTTDRDIAESLVSGKAVQTTVVIKAPAGTKVGFLPKYRTEDVDDEREGLLPRGLKLRVTSVVETKRSTYTAREIHATIE